MIEVVYKEEKSIGQESVVHLPKNIRQIGLPCGSSRIYMEDYVNTFLRKMSDARSAGAALLLGEIKYTEGNTYIFIRCAYKIEEKMTLEHISFTDETWGKIRDGIEHYFPDQNIIGWFFTAAGLPMTVENMLYRIQMTYFNGQDNILYLLEAQEKEEAFFRYDNGQMCRQSGYYVYYEQNPLMQSYMVDKNQNQAMEDETEVKDTAVKNFRKILKNMRDEDDEEEEIEKGGNWFTVAATAAIAIAVLVAGSNFLSSYQKMKAMQEQLKSAESELTASDEVSMEKEKDVRPTVSAKVTKEAAEPTPTVLPTETPTLEEKMREHGVPQDEADTQADRQTNSQANTEETVSNPNLQTYEIQEGDSLTSIAEEFYGDISMVDKICELNGIEEPEMIYEGKIIVLP